MALCLGLLCSTGYAKSTVAVLVGEGSLLMLDKIDGQTLKNPDGVGVGVDGSIVIADSFNHRVLLVKDGKVKVIAGIGRDKQGYPATPDNSRPSDEATNTELKNPQGVAIGVDGSIVIADAGNHRVLQVTKGKAKVIAGTGVGWNGRPVASDLNLPADDATNIPLTPKSVAVGADGSILILNVSNYQVLLVKGGKASVIPRTGFDSGGRHIPVSNSSLDDAAITPLDTPNKATCPDGSVIFAESSKHRVLLIAPEDEYQGKLNQLITKATNAKKKNIAAVLKEVEHDLTYLGIPIDRCLEATTISGKVIPDILTDLLPREIWESEIVKYLKEPSPFKQLRAQLALKKLQRDKTYSVTRH